MIQQDTTNNILYDSIIKRRLDGV